VLPYVNLNERRDDWRADFHDRFAAVAYEAGTIEDAVLALNKYVFESLNVRYHATKRRETGSESLRDDGERLCVVHRTVDPPRRCAPRCRDSLSRGRRAAVAQRQRQPHLG
jgi:hypothetical protein